MGRRFESCRAHHYLSPFQLFLPSASLGIINICVCGLCRFMATDNDDQPMIFHSVHASTWGRDHGGEAVPHTVKQPIPITELPHPQS